VPPMVLMALPLNVSLRVTVYFLGAIGAMEEAFLGWYFGREILLVGTQILMKAPVCGGDFSSLVIRRSILTTHKR